MERKLKLQRKKLIWRITLIMIAVWISVSAVYFGIIIYSEKNSVQKREYTKLSDITLDLSFVVYEYQFYESFFRDSVDMIYKDDGKTRDWDSQLAIIDQRTGDLLADTTSRDIVSFGTQIDPDHPSTEYGLINYKEMRKRMSDDEYKMIEKYLNTYISPQKRYELVCTRFVIDNLDIIPVQLQIVMTDDRNTWFVNDSVIVTIDLDSTGIDSEEIFECNVIQRNIVPRDFISDKSNNENLIVSISAQQRESSFSMVPVGKFRYILYAYDYAFIQTPNEERYSLLIMFAKKVNLLELCKTRLILGLSVFFVFLCIIGTIICAFVMKMIKNEALNEKNRAELTNALAHDIKTPLFVISGYAYSLKENIDEDEKDRYLDKIIEQTEKINTLVHNMLNLSKLDMYSITLNRTDFDLCELTEKLLENYEQLPDRKNIVFEHSGDNRVNGDVSLITTALGNLIDNAIHYSLKETAINIGVNDKTFMISNKCEPLSKPELKQIWQPYVRKDKSRHRKGNGLGLSIVKSILDLHKIKCKTEMKDDTLSFGIDFKQNN